MNKEETIGSPATDTPAIRLDEYQLSEELLAGLHPVLREIIALLSFPILLEAIRKQGTNATSGDSIIKLIELYLLTNGHEQELSKKGNVTLSRRSSGKYQEAIAEAIGLAKIAKRYTNIRFKGRKASEALEEIMGRMWVATDYNFKYCLNLYTEMLKVTSGKSAVTIPADIHRPTSMVEKKITQPIRSGLVNSTAVIPEEDERIESPAQAWEKRLETIFKSITSNDTSDPTVLSGEEPDSDPAPLYQAEIPEGYSIHVEQAGSAFAAWAIDSSGRQVPETYALHKRKKSARNHTLSLLLQLLQLDI